MLTTGTATDYYGGFPVVAPGGGSYSLKLGNSATGGQAERARYYVQVPAGVNNYSLIYRYAVVFENPNHTPSEQPRFEVKAFDSATAIPIPCNDFTYVASSSLPGFFNSPNAYGVKWKGWTTASIDLSGWAGHTIAIDFSVGDCAQGAHFGYGYLDMNCALFQVTNVNCNGSPTTNLNAPPGFQTYSWWNANFTTQVGSGQNVTIPTPASSGQYHVILTPYSGYGCPDTLTTTVNVASLTLNATSDTTICKGTAISLSANAVTNASSVTYSWTPAAGLSCTSCSNPTVSPSQATSYIVTANDANGCSKSDTISIGVNSVTSIVTTLDATCFGSSDGTATVYPVGGVTPYSYSWNTAPVQTTATASSLGAGYYSVIVADANGCSDTATATIDQPQSPLSGTVAALHVSCNGGADGSATVNVTGGTPPYTYNWNTSPVQTTASASGLLAGTYTVSITDANGCTASQTIVVSEPSSLSTSVTGSSPVACYGGSNGTATVSAIGGTAPYAYVWNTIPQQTGTTAGNLGTGNHTVTVTDARGCTTTAMVVVAGPSAPVSASIISSSNVLCNGGSNGSATVGAQGGSSPYTYSWNTTPVQTSATASNLGAGTYTVTVTDGNGCTATANAMITQPAPALAVSITGSTMLPCFGAANGQVTAVSTGGTGPYSYNWNTAPAQAGATATGLAAGTYSVTVTDANGCTAAQSVTLNEPSAINASVSGITNVSCYGSSDGTAVALATGGTGAYNYSWNSTPVQNTQTAGNLSAGNYVVTVTDANGCLDTAQVTVSQPLQLTATTTVANLNCLGSNNGTATAIVSGGTSPYSYTWNTTPVQSTVTATGLSTGSYAVVVTDANGCTGTGNATILPPSTPVNVSVIASTPVTCAGGASGSATALGSAGTPPYTYFWNTVPAQTTATAANLPAGTYMVTVSDANGCGDTASVTIAGPTSPLALGLSNITNVSCFGGSDGVATVTPSGGTAPYSYSWNTTPVQTSATGSGLAAGTYSVTVTDANGCNAVQTVVITEPPAMNIALTSSAVSCNGGTDGSATALVTGGVTPYIYNWLAMPAQTTPSVAGIAAGTCQVNVTDANGCTVTATTQVSEPTPLTSTISVANLFCSGGNSGSATVTPAGGVAPYSYSWNTTPVQTTALASNLGIGNYTVTITDANGCTATNTANIAPPSTPVSVSIGNVVPVQCFGTASGSATAMPSGGTAPYSYVWNTAPVQSTATAANLSAGNYTVTITDNNGCAATASVSIVQPASGITASIVNVSPVSCHNAANGQATVSASGGAAPYAYSWNTIPVQTTATGSNLAAGTWIATVADANGCVDTQSVTITEPAPLAVSLSNLTGVSCSGGSDGAATTAASGGTAPYSWSWNTSPVQTTPSANGLTAGTYILTVTDNNNCTDTIHATIAEPTLLTSGIALQNPLCQGSTGTATAVPAGGTPPYSFNWSTTPAQTSATVSNLGAGTYFLAVTDANGCVFNDTVTFSTPATGVVANAVVQSSVKCFGGTDGSALATATGGTAPYSYLWNTVPSQSMAAATGLSAGTYMVTVTDDNGCFDTATITITQPSEIIVGVNTTKTCFGLNDGTAVATVSGGSAPYNITWASSPVQSGTTASNLAAGTYTVAVTDNLLCSKSTSFSIENFEPVLLDAGPDQVLCDGTSVTLQATGATSYLWKTDSSLSCTTCSDPVADPSQTTVYTVTGTDNNGCEGTDDVTVTVIKKGPVSIEAQKEICAGESVALSASGGDSYYWYPGAGLDRNNVSGPVASPAATTAYSVIIQQGSCFKDTLQQIVVVHELPVVDLGQDYKGMAGDAYTIPLIYENATGIEWLPAQNLSCSDCFDPVAILETDVTYVAKVWNSLGCYATDDITIKVGCDRSVLFIPNTFTPNGDGFNDLFYPRGRGMKKITRFQVYSRWGELIFDGKNVSLDEASQGWDGTYKNQQLDPDVFVYVIEGVCDNDELVSVKGDITLFR